MEVILTDEVESLGYSGDIVRVRDGYARNYLFPRGLAVLATRGAREDAARIKANREGRLVKRRAEFEALASQIASKSVRIEKAAGSGTKLYGSVTATDIAQALAAQHGLEVDRKHLVLAAPVKTLGQHHVALRLTHEVQVEITIEVARQGGELVAEGAAEEAPLTEPVEESFEAVEETAVDEPAAVE